MAEYLVQYLRASYFVFIALSTLGGAALVSLGVLTVMDRVIGKLLNLAALVEIAREAKRQGRTVWLQRATRWQHRRR